MANPPEANWPPAAANAPLAVLAGGGSDSAILLGEAARVYPAVHPIFIRTGAAWEKEELAHLKLFAEAIRVQPVTILELPVTDLYGEHWSLTGKNVPDETTEDDAVYLPGRNVILLAKALIWCHLQGIHELATAPLSGNPFPDATDEFYEGYTASVNRALGGWVNVLRPYAAMGLHKADVLKRGKGMQLQFTFSCLRPAKGRHCGRCNKCAERQLGFRAAGMPDPTTYND